MLTPPTIACVFFTGGVDTPSWSKCYGTTWVDRLYRGVRHWYGGSFRFVCLTDRFYHFEEDIIQEKLRMDAWQNVCLQLHGVQAPGLLVHVGLDTVFTGPLDDIFHYSGDCFAIPRDPYNPSSPCNGVVLGHTAPEMAQQRGVTDMSIFTKTKHVWLDDLFPHRIVSYKVHIRTGEIDPKKTSIVYFHGIPKQHELPEEDYIAKCWRGEW